jgi:hypothetical protein
MRLIKYTLQSIIYIGALFLIFSCESDDNTTNFVEPTPTLNGTYVLTSLDADVTVDLNNDSTTSTNLLQESTCFNIMEVTFNNDGSFSATNSKLDFNGGDSGNELTCTIRTDNGTWSLNANELTLNVSIAGSTITETKEIMLTETSFSFTATEDEIDAYVNDTSESSASVITELFLEYTQQ